MLEAVGLPEMVIPDLETYERRAIDLALNPPLLQAVRRQLRSGRESYPLFDTPRFVGNLERAYLAMWTRHESGELPGMLTVRDSSDEES